MSTRTLRTALLVAALHAATVAVGQEPAAVWPLKPVTIVVPFAAGGNTDVKTRLLAQRLAPLLGQPVVVENRPGASGNIGMDFVAKARPDGYTIGMGSFGPLAVNASLYPRLAFDPKSLAPIILLERSPLVLVTPHGRPFRSVADVIAAAKARPGMLSIANAGPGGAHHLSAELLESVAGIAMLAVPYKGGGPASNALLAGDVDLMFEQTGAALPSLQAGKIRALGVTAERRLAALPDVPTFAEMGWPQVTVSNWMGYVAPRETPPRVVTTLHAAFAKVIAMPDVRDRIVSQGNEVGAGSPAEFAAFIQGETDKWSRLVRARGIRIE